jgi:hypothetical protein
MNVMKWGARSLALAALVVLVSSATAGERVSAPKEAISTAEPGTNGIRIGQEGSITGNGVREGRGGTRVEAGKDTSPRAKPGDPPWMRTQTP